MVDDRFEDWVTPPTPLPKGWKQRRGYALERIIAHILSEEGFDPKTHIRPNGEEIDGSFVFADRIFLFEAKWKAEPVPASEFYAFKGKIDGKLVGTVGVFISMSGFSPDAVDALKFGKEINLILFNGSDFQLVAEGKITFAKALRTKLRYATEEGQPFLPLSAGPDSIGVPPEPENAQPHSTPMPLTPGAVNIVVEGAADQEALHILLGRIDPKLASAVRIYPAGGQLNIPSLLRRLGAEGAAVSAVIESDIPMASLTEVREVLQAVGGYVYVVTPSLEDLLESACSATYINALPATGNKLKAVRRVARNADIDRLYAQDRKLKAFIAWLQGMVNGEQGGSPSL